MKRISNLTWARLGLLIGATAIILFFMPHADRQSYSYELNAPWKYPLLTADFDMPILRDSMSANALRDSIDVNFVPFVKRDSEVGEKALVRFQNSIAGKAGVSEAAPPQSA